MLKIIQFIVLGIFVSVTSTGQSYIPVKHDNRILKQPVSKIMAYGFDFSRIKLLKGSAYYEAMQADMNYILSLDPDRLLARFYKNAGLPQVAPPYGGWESEGLSGHTLGHYLSSMSILFASTRKPELKKNIDYVAKELRNCQINRNTGYVGAIPKEDSIFGLVRRGIIHTGGFDLNGGWAPWYTVHKLLAGLLDAYLYADSKNALEIARGLGDWTDDIVSNLNDSLMQKMLKCEYGGMNDALAMLYAVTGEKKYLQLSYRFYDDFVMAPLSQRRDALQNKHANTNIPKGVGASTQYIYGGADRDSIIAQYMFNTIVHHHSYANGGNGNYEYFGQENKLSERLSDANSETCATYNMEKLAASIFSWQPQASIMDYFERAQINGILSSQNPESAMFCYFVPLRMGGQKEFSDSLNTFTCCVGTGMENHAKYTQAIYYQSPDSKNLYINLFIPSQLQWLENRTSISILSDILKTDTINIFVDPAKVTAFNLKLRKPNWAKVSDIKLLINGKELDMAPDNKGYYTIYKNWKKGDKVTYILKRKLYAEPMIDNSKRLAIYYGPVLLAGELGKRNPDPVAEIPVILSENDSVEKWMRPRVLSELKFYTTKETQPLQVPVKPFYAIHEGHYNVYWDVFTKREWSQKKAEYIAQKEHEKDIEARTIDLFRIGEMQPERDHDLATTGNSYVSEAFGKHGREARSGGSMSFTMKVNPDGINSLLIHYIGADKNRTFDIEVDGKILVTEVTRTDVPEDKFYEREYLIPQSFTEGKKRISIRVLANHGSTAGRTFEIRTMNHLQ